MDNKIESQVCDYNYPEGSERIAFVLFNNSGKTWELADQRPSGMEHYSEAPLAVGLIFDKDSAKDMAEQLRELANKLDSI